MLLGLTFAILASLGSGVGSAVEAFGVRRAAAKGKPAGDLARCCTSRSISSA
jgi:hypothetical protein